MIDPTRPKRCPHGHIAALVESEGGWITPMAPESCPVCKGKPCGIKYKPGNGETPEVPESVRLPTGTCYKPGCIVVCTARQCGTFDHDSPCLVPLKGQRIAVRGTLRDLTRTEFWGLIESIGAIAVKSGPKADILVVPGHKESKSKLAKAVRKHGGRVILESAFRGEAGLA